jgi:hypothetical protein
MVPSQTLLFVASETMLTEGTTLAITVVEIEFDVAGEPVAQTVFEVMITVTDCPLVNALVVYVALLVPTFAPFTRH